MHPRLPYVSLLHEDGLSESVSGPLEGVVWPPPKVVGVALTNVCDGDRSRISTVP